MLAFSAKQDVTLSFESATVNALTTDGTKAVQAVTASVQGLSYTYTSSDTSIASVSGTTITIHKSGSVTITASFAGNESYNPASASYSLVVSKANVTLSFTNATVNTTVATSTMSVQTVTSSVQGLTIIYSSGNSSVATVNGTTITIVNTGTAIITASFAGNETYNPASASYSLVVAAATTDNVITYKASAKLTETTSTYSGGLHTNAFNTSISSHVFANGVGTITLNADVTSIGQYAFYNCTGMTEIEIPSKVTSVGNNALRGCSALNKITCKATTAPTISSSTFRSVKTGGTLYVPTGSTGYNTWMGTGNYYLGRYSWTKVEQ